MPCAHSATDTVAAGVYTVDGAPTSVYSTCEDRGWLRGSYEYTYTADNSIVPGYEEALCVQPVIAPGGVVCMGMWWEPDNLFGIYMNVMSGPGAFYSTWWAGLSVDYPANHANSDEHAVETETQRGVASSSQCDANSMQWRTQVATASQANVVRIAGSWNLQASLGYTGATSICWDRASNKFRGLTAGVTVWSGTVMANRISGRWTDAGAAGFLNLTVAPALDVSTGVLPSTGTFNLTYSAGAGGSAVLTGTKGYDGITATTPITFTSTSLLPVTDASCFAPGVVSPLSYCIGAQCIDWKPSRAWIAV